MKLPEGWDAFYESTLSKTKTLIKNQVWLLDWTSTQAWMANFSVDVHRYLAAHMLDRLIYRSERMAESSFRFFFSTEFYDLALTASQRKDIDTIMWLKELKNPYSALTKDVVICPVLKSIESGESGGEIARLLTSDLVPEKKIHPISHQSLDELEGKMILLVDDFVGSGRQFIEFAEKTNLKLASSKNEIVYAPLMAFYKGIDNINKKDFGVKVKPLELVTDSERFFTHKEGAFFCGDGINSESEVINTYREMCKLDANFHKKFWMGDDNASLCVAFQWGCPNQTLGAMWYDGGDDWSKLLRRRGSQ